MGGDDRMSGPAPRPITLQIAALGGEGGGVLTDWIVAAASQAGFPVQSTSIPGVAQRTGATTYYIEIVPLPWRELGDKRPILALAPGVGDVDIVVASELLEAGRAIGSGFVTPDRTLMIASTARSYLVVERMAMGDGRYDSARLVKAIEEHAQENLLLDMDALAKQSGAMINAVMLGIIAGSERLPMPAAIYEDAIRADGKAVDANLRGFRAGLVAAKSAAARAADDGKRRHGAVPSVAALEAEASAIMPAATTEIVVEGLRRTAAYQDVAYAGRYLDRLKAICEADDHADAGGRLVRETARQLAVRMTFEDVIRVAEAKIAPERFARIRAELGLKDGEPFRIVEVLKPGLEEMCQILPPRLALRVLSWAERRGWRPHWGMEIESTALTGYLRFWALAKLKRFRPRGHRFALEQTAIEAWLKLILEAAHLSADVAIEVAECARLIKGYGDTWQRGSTNYQTIEAQVIRPALAGRIAPNQAADAIASARTAALVDPEGDGLAKCLAEIASRTAAVRMAAE
jgi:indolepyruvate ferredoxin oxidoreductase beta subunit